ATTARHSAQNIAFHEVGRQAIMADPDWQGGAYYKSERAPQKGLSVARMAAHITYLSEQGLTERFGRQLQVKDGKPGAKSFGFDADFQVESYLRHQGISFTDRFDANSYLYITRAMDYFDLAEEAGGRLADAFAGAKDTRFCLVSFDTDWLYTTADMREIVHALNAVAAPVSFVELSAPFGHDSFLLDVPALDRVVKGFIQ
ncbi:MAG: homoserine O-acetyltransferase, partial [Alteraurantiacibacter sp.]